MNLQEFIEKLHEPRLDGEDDDCYCRRVMGQSAAVIETTLAERVKTAAPSEAPAKPKKTKAKAKTKKKPKKGDG